MSVSTTGGGVLFAPSQELTQTSMGELVVAQFTPLAAARFDYTINPKLYTTVTSNGGTVTVDTNRAKLTTSVAINGSASVQTINKCRYIPGIGSLSRFTACFATGTANSQQIIGIGGLINGFFFGYNGTSFGIMRRRDSIDSWVAQGSWNGSALTMSHNTSFGNIYQIRYQWLSYSPIKFYIFDSTLREFVLVHQIDYPNTTQDVSILNPNLPCFSEIKNTGNNTSLSMYTPSAIVGLECKIDAPNPLEIFVGASVGPVVLTDTNNNHILSVKNDTVIGATINLITLKINSCIVSRENNAVKGSIIRIYLDATTAIARTYTAIDATHSPSQYSTTATTISSGTVRYAISLPAGAGPFTFDLEGDIYLQPGEIMTVACQNTAVTSTDIFASVDFVEQF